MELHIPEAFKEIDEKQKKDRFPYETTPQIIYVDESATLACNLLDKSLEEQEVLAASREMERQLSHVYPESRIRPAAILKNDDTVIGGFSFKSDSLCGEVRHDMFLCPVENKFFFGGLHYPNEEEHEWSGIFAEIIKNIKTVKGKSNRKRTGVE